MATVYAVASAKGGVGKTTTTAALATILAESGADVVAVDADIGMANLAGVLGLEIDETTIHDVLAGRAEPADALHDGPAGLRVIPGETDLDAYAEADPSGIRDVIAAFDDVDYVFVDAGAGLSHDSSLPLALADETLLVSTVERGALGDTEKTRQLTERLGGSVPGAALTRVDADEPEPELVSELLDAPILGRIPEDDAVSRAVRADESLVTFAPTAPATAAYRELARELTGESIADPTPDSQATAGTSASDETSGDDVSGDDVDEAIDDDGNDGDDIIVADDGPVGVGEEAGDEEEIIVADEDGSVDEPADEVDETPDEVADESTDEVLDATTDESTSPTTADHAHHGTDDTVEERREVESAPDESEEASIDDELAGSVPFRDDDSRTSETPLAEETDPDGGDDPAETDAAEREEAPERTDDPDPEGDSEDEADSTDDEQKSGGFFSRLFGR